MDRMSDSGSDDMSSNLVGDTKKSCLLAALFIFYKTPDALGPDRFVKIDSLHRQ